MLNELSNSSNEIQQEQEQVQLRDSNLGHKFYTKFYFCDFCMGWIHKEKAIWIQKKIRKYPTCPKPSCNKNRLKTKSIHYKSKPTKTNKPDKEIIVGRPFYDNENKTGLCPYCVKVWKIHQQIMYTTNNGKRTYGICPQCKVKHPLRKRPRTRDAWLRKFPVKRIE